MHLANSSFFQKGAPKLTHLTLSTLSIPCTYIPFDNVHSLTLSSSGRWTHPTHLADFLNDSRFPKLKSLHLHHDILFSRSKLQKSPIELKALRTLKFSGYHTKSANALSCLYTPNLRHLILDTLYPDQFSRLQFYQLLKQTPNKYPKLKKLTLRASEDQASEDQGADELLEQIVSPDSIIPIDIVPESQRLIPQTVLHIAHVFPNIQKLVINKALVHPLNVIVSQKEMDIEGNDTTSSVWNAWPDLKMIQVEVVAPNWGVIVLNESLKKGRNERDDVKVVYRRRTKLNRGMKS
ncbi:hypothetical protein AX16_009845 [Volvariella volvacea WC 439]|nr:hypothetical protein AX16_009845 [Volvariella volvacea WC 439]